MRLKLYRAASVAGAMAQVRAELGSEALILSTRRVGDGVELTAAIEPADEMPEVPQTALPQPQSRADLAYHGIPEAIAARLAGSITPSDLARALGRVLRFADLPVHGADSRPLLLAGMPGAGKTLAVARLATRFVLSGIRPTVITADGRRAGAAEELAAYTRLLGLNLLVASTPSTLARGLASLAGQAPAPVLIDTSGINPFAPQDLESLSALAQAADAVPVLVMQAGLHPEEAAEQAHAMATIGVRHLLPTRLDMVRRLGSVLAAAAATNLSLTEAGNGAGATDALVPITPAFLAERLLAVAPSSQPDELRRPVFPRARNANANAWRTERYG